MNRDFASSLIQLNNTFYREHSASFSDTRQAPWPGWVRTMDIALEQLDVATIEHPVRVFDLACGNMRFENFAAGGALAAKGVDGANPSADASCPFEFYGVDSCQDLAIDAHGHAVGDEHFDGGLPSRLGQRMSVAADVQRAGHAGLLAVFGDGLGDGDDMGPR